MTVSIMAQKVPIGAKDASTITPARDNEYVCQPLSIFSQVFPTYDNAYFCQAGYYYYIATDDYSATAPFSTFRFWGGDYYACSLAPTEPFNVTIYNGDPSLGGTPIFAATLTGFTTSLGIFSYSDTPLYQIDINLGTTINQLNGWIAVTRNGATCYDGFAWLSSGSGNSMSYGGGSWTPISGNLMFCLGGEAEEVPVSNWSLYIGIGLILVFAVVRFRKIV